MLNKNYIVYLLSFFTITLLFAVSTGCNAPSPLPTGTQPDMVIDHCTITNYKDNKIEFILKADKISKFLNEKKTNAENINLDYYKDGQISAVVSAKNAVMSDNMNVVELTRSVEITSTSGNKLFTEKITGYIKENYLDTDEFVKIVHKNGDILTGSTGLKADFNIEVYEFKGTFKAVSSSIVKDLKKTGTDK